MTQVPFSATVRMTDDYALKVSLDHGARQFDLRYHDRMGPGRNLFPTKRGLTLGLADLPELIDTLTLIEGKAREAGLLPTAPLPSPQEIEAAQTEAGGWTKATLNAWGVAWPPPQGWRAELEAAYAAHHGRAKA